MRIKEKKPIAIITPVYMAWDMVRQCCEMIDKRTHNDYIHILVDDSSPEKVDLSGEKRIQLQYNDGLPPEQHRANITKALQIGYQFLKDNYDFDQLFIVESDVMVPMDWDQKMLDLSRILPLFIGLEAFAINDDGQPEYPMNVNPPIGKETHGDKEFQVVKFCDFNCILIHEDMLEDPDFAFDMVPSHHDILLCQYWKEKNPERQCYRTQDVNVVHYPNSSRSLLPQGMNTPSN